MFSRITGSSFGFVVIAFLPLMLLFPALAGCVKESAKPESMSLESAGPPPPPTAGDASRAQAFDKNSESAGEAAQPLPSENLAIRGRKLIREGNVSLKVKSVVDARSRIEKLVQEKYQGFVSNIAYDHSSSSESLTITVRIPAERFMALVEELRGIGYVTGESYNVTDVTDQYVDLDRRIKTNEMLAARLEQLIAEKSYQFEDLLAVERELARLRLEIEQLQGSLRGLEDRISLSTLSIALAQEIEQQVVPPDSVFAPIVNTIENSGARLRGSLNAMMRAVGALADLVITLLPWIPIILVVWWLLRRRRRKKAAKKAAQS